jgi:uncharacterized protein YciI
MTVYVCRLIPPRASFMQDMDAAEAAVMRAHVAYWTELAGRGVALLFGPVADPAGGWGLGIIEAADAAELATLTAADPVMRADLGFRYETLPMLRTVFGERRAGRASS